MATPAQFDALLDEVRERANTEPQFATRMAPIVEMINESVPRHERSFAYGIAGLALHMDDKASGRWPKSSAEGWDH